MRETGHTRLTEEKIPALSGYAGHLISEASLEPKILSKVRPRGLTVDRPLRVAMESATYYLLAYVESLAEREPERAKLIAESVEVPVVRKLGDSKAYIFEKRMLASVIEDKYRAIGSKVRENISHLIEEVRKE